MPRTARLLLLLALLAPFASIAPAAQAATATAANPATPERPLGPEEQMLARIFAEALTRGEAFENLRVLVTETPGRLAGSKALEHAVLWGERVLGALQPDRVFRQEVTVPHWERGAQESVALLGARGPEPLSALALGGSVGTPAGGVTAEVIEVQSLDELNRLDPARVAGRIVFFNRPMDPTKINPGSAYGLAGDQRNRGPAAAARLGAVAALTRSLTHALDDRPHTGQTVFAPGTPRIPACALSTIAANRLSAALRADPHARVTLQTHARWLPDALSHNVIAEVRGTEFPDQIILVGGHLDSWDVAPGAHDDGSGIVQSIEVLRIFRALGVKPRHTLRCVLFTNEENGTRGAAAYADLAARAKERHVLAVETDNGGFQPRGFNLGSTQGNAHERAAAKWGAWFEPYGIRSFVKGSGGADISALLAQGSTVAGLTPDSQRYFDLHHTTADALDQVNPRELHLGAAALAALIWLVDTQGL